MLEHLRKRLKLPAEKMAISLPEFGNTSCASIPLTLSHVLPERLKREPVRMLLAGFGVGWSWGAAPVTPGPMVMPEIRHIGAKA
jgi:3-oxoacyl-[acyl-carrier-protein] synthase-3